MKKRWKKTAAAVFMIIALVCLTGVFLIRDSAENLELTHYTAENAGLPESFAGFKIVQLSDFHGAEFIDDIVSTVKAEKPDIIALTGDFITDGGDLPAVRELAQRLTDICDVYFVSGNHDFASGKIDELSDILKACGVKYLRNEYVVLERRGERIVLAGVEDPNSWADLEPPEEFIGRLRAEFPGRLCRPARPPQLLDGKIPGASGTAYPLRSRPWRHRAYTRYRRTSGHR